MAEFGYLEELKAEIADLATPEEKERKKSAIRRMDRLEDAVEEAIEVFCLLNPAAMAEFKSRIAAKRLDADAFGAPNKATSDEKSMELRSELWFPTVAVEVTGARGKKRVRYMDLKGVLASIYSRFGFEDFPNAQNAAEFRMLKAFHRRWGSLFAVAEKL
jgi:hypothetical protein